MTPVQACSSVHMVQYGEFILSLDDSLTIHKLNEGYTRITGYRMEDILKSNHTFEQLVHPDDWNEIREKLARTLGRGGTLICGHRILTKEGVEKSVLLEAGIQKEEDSSFCIRCIIISGPELSVLLKEDISAVKTGNYTAGHVHPEVYLYGNGCDACDLALMDSLTFFWSKNAAPIIINNYLSDAPEGKLHVLLVIDIIEFKNINKNNGRLYGDTVLENLAATIRSVFTSQDIIARTGGDEFTVLAKDSGTEAALKKAEKVCSAVSEGYLGKMPDIKLAARIGMAVYPYNGRSYEELKRNADLAAYLLNRDKREGCNFYSAENENRGIIAADARIEPVLSKTLDRKAGLYDPDIVSLAFDLLATAKDLGSNLEILMEEIGEQYDLSKILVLENKNSRHVMFTTHFWSTDQPEEGEISRAYHYDIWHDFLDAFDERGMLAIDDCKSHSSHKADMEALNKLGAQSLICCGIYNADNTFCGCIVFADCKNLRNWKGIAKETLLELSKVMSYFILMRNESIKAQSKIEKLANYDRVTGLYNLEKFKEEAEKIRRSGDGADYAVAYSDISNFAYINDVYGYERGDDLLFSFAKCFAHENPRCKVAGRIFSDYFVLLVEVDGKEAFLHRVVSDNERFSHDQKTEFPHSDIHVMTGIYFLEDKDVLISEAVDNANMARKEIKGNRKAYCRIYSDEMRQKSKKEAVTLSDLEEAMESGRLEVYFQPKMSLKTGTMVGAEALVRWHEKDGLMIYPDDFIPALERAGTIVDLDFYVYEQVLKQIRKWMGQKKRIFRISVNLSRLHGNYDDFAERLLNITQKYQVPCDLIEFEVTESAFVTESQKLISKLDMLRKAGFKTSIDDFGVGYSSLSMLYDAPADIVKMDKSFLTDSEVSKEKREMVHLIIEMIHVLHKEVIFEGVETREQAEYLLQCGCETVQGFLFSKPLPVGEFEELYLT